MSKNLWIAGQSGNPNGKLPGTRYSAKTVKGRIERFLSRNMSAKALQSMFNKLSERDQGQLLVALLPFVMPRQSMDAISGDQIDELYDKITRALDQKSKANIEGMSNEQLKQLEKNLTNAKVG
jgi:hypothetical protein